MKNKYHYVYRITNTQEKKHYYGVRSSKIEPKLDLGIKYFSSSTDKYFIKEQKENKSIFKYKIIKRFESREEAIKLEIKLHNKFDVGRNKLFYNKAKQTSTGFTARLGMKNSDFQKKRASETHKGKIISDEQKNLTINNANFINTRWKGTNSLILYKQNNPEPCQKSYKIYNHNNIEIFSFDNVSLRNFCKDKNLPYTALYESKLNGGSPLYQTTYRLNKIKKKGYEIYTGWYCIEV